MSINKQLAKPTVQNHNNIINKLNPFKKTNSLKPKLSKHALKSYLKKLQIFFICHKFCYYILNKSQHFLQHAKTTNKTNFIISNHNLCFSIPRTLCKRKNS